MGWRVLFTPQRRTCQASPASMGVSRSPDWTAFAMSLRMTCELPLDDDVLLGLLARLRPLERDARSETILAEQSLSELRRQARARPKRRGGEGSADAEKYKLGSVLVQLGFAGADDLALLGLLASGDRALQWLCEARLERGAIPFVELVSAAISKSGRLDWCREWGNYHWRLHNKRAYDAAVTSFIEAGPTGAEEGWRKHDASGDQIALIAKLCDLLDEPLPKGLTKGEAFDWIYERGGNPAHWHEPTEPAEWEA